MCGDTASVIALTDASSSGIRAISATADAISVHGGAGLGLSQPSFAGSKRTESVRVLTGQQWSQATDEAHTTLPTRDVPSLASRIARIASTIGADHFPTGERAALKRMPPNESPGLVFFRFWPRYLGTDTPPDAQALDWSVILAGIALMGRSAPQSGRRFGTVLAETRYSEGRLERLLGTEDTDVRRVLFLRAVRFLAAKGEPFDWLGAAAWLLSTAEKRDEAARRIARDFYSAQSRLERENKE